MKIGSEAFNVAVKHITESNQPKVSFNVPVEDSFSNVHAILIHESNAALIDKLVNDGFSLSMKEKGLSVDYYKTSEGAYKWF